MLAANTWKKVTKTIIGDSNITVDNDTDTGLELHVWPYLGTNYTDSSVVLDEWNAYSSSAQIPDFSQSWANTAGATFDLTGVQLEVGSQATPFEHRSFGDELLRCQRYYIEYGKDLNVNGPTTFRAPLFDQNTISSGYCFAQVDFPVDMRTSGTFTAYKAANGSGADLNNTNWSPFTPAANQRHMMIQKHTNSMTGNQTTVYLMFDMDAEL